MLTKWDEGKITIFIHLRRFYILKWDYLKKSVALIEGKRERHRTS